MNPPEKPYIRSILARNIRVKRQEAKISQEELAELSNLHRTYIGAIERGQQNVSVDNIEKIALALNVSVGDLFKEEHNEITS